MVCDPAPQNSDFIEVEAANARQPFLPKEN